MHPNLFNRAADEREREQNTLIAHAASFCPEWVYSALYLPSTSRYFLLHTQFTLHNSMYKMRFSMMLCDFHLAPIKPFHFIFLFIPFLSCITFFSLRLGIPHRILFASLQHFNVVFFFSLFHRSLSSPYCESESHFCCCSFHSIQVILLCFLL